MGLVATSIDSVTVFTDRALVVRRGEIELAAGEHELVVGELPLSLVAESVRASARATGPMRLLATDVRQTYTTVPAAAGVAELMSRIEVLEDEAQALEWRVEGWTERRQFLKDLAEAAGRQFARGVSRDLAPLARTSELAALLTSELGTVGAGELEVRKAQRLLLRELEARRNELANRQSASGLAQQQVAVAVALAADATVSLELRYQVSGASWTPLYDLRLQESGPEPGERPTLDLTYRGQVTQYTGESWDNVALTLSTAKPAVSATIPELSPWFIEVWSPAPPSSLPGAPRMMAAATGGAFAGEGVVERKVDMDLMPAQTVSAEISDAGPAVTFGIPTRATIPSDGSPHNVMVGDFPLEAKLDYVTAPKLVTQAFRRATVSNTSPALLLPGPVQLFTGDEFVGTTRVETVAPTEEFEVHLGVDDRVKVERDLVQSSVDKKFLQDKAVMNYAWKITVTNLLPRPETVTVRDQIPVSRHDQVKVRRGEITPAPKEETEMGELTWALALEPGAKAEIRFGFALDAPRDLRLVGLPPLRD